MCMRWCAFHDDVVAGLDVPQIEISDMFDQFGVIELDLSFPQLS